MYISFHPLTQVNVHRSVMIHYDSFSFHIFPFTQVEIKFLLLCVEFFYIIDLFMCTMCIPILYILYFSLARCIIYPHLSFSQLI